ncbi:Hydrogenase maturation factor HypC [uncultured Gammaproteobacteria bacterium]
MCLGVPACIEQVLEDDMAVVNLDGVRMTISLALIDDAGVGDYVIVHVGHALHKLDQEEAAATLSLLAEAGLLRGEPATSATR